MRLEGLKPVVAVSKNWIFRGFLNLYEALLFGNDTRESYLEKQAEADEKKEISKKKQAMGQVKSARTDRTSDDDDAGGALRRPKVAVQKWYDTVDPKEINQIV